MTTADQIADQIARAAPGVDVASLTDDLENARWEHVAAALVRWGRENPESPPPAPPAPPAPSCELCVDNEGPVHLHSRCHMTAPLSAEMVAGVLTLRCYLPACARTVARVRVSEILPIARGRG